MSFIRRLSPQFFSHILRMGLVLCACLLAASGFAETESVAKAAAVVAPEVVAVPDANVPDARASDTSVSDIRVPEKRSSSDYVMQLIASLLVVLLAIGALAWLLKRVNKLPGKRAGHMQVLGAMSLGTRERAVLVQVGDKQMLLGVAPGRVSTLHVFDEPVMDPEDSRGAATLGNSFASILGSLNNGQGKS